MKTLVNIAIVSLLCSTMFILTVGWITSKPYYQQKAGYFPSLATISTDTQVLECKTVDSCLSTFSILLNAKLDFFTVNVTHISNFRYSTTSSLVTTRALNVEAVLIFPIIMLIITTAMFVSTLSSCLVQNSVTPLISHL